MNNLREVIVSPENRTKFSDMNCMVWGKTGSGKSLVAFNAVIKEIKKNKKVLYISDAVYHYQNYIDNASINEQVAFNQHCSMFRNVDQFNIDDIIKISKELDVNVIIIDDFNLVSGRTYTNVLKLLESTPVDVLLTRIYMVTSL